MALASNHNLTEQEVTAIQEALKTTPSGLTSFDLQRVLSGSTNPNVAMDLRILMHQLKDTGVVMTTGQLRGMRYIWGTK
jgi:hypothetical protein